MEVSKFVSTLGKPVEDLPDSCMLLAPPDILNAELSKAFPVTFFFFKSFFHLSSINSECFQPFYGISTLIWL